MTPSPPRRLTWKHRLLLLGFGLALVGLLEVGLRLAGLGGRAPLLRPLQFDLPPVLPPGSQVYEIHPQVSAIFFSRDAPGGSTLVGGHRREVVVMPKPPGVLRVVFVGASTVEGFPLPRNLTAARFLQSWLQQTLPGRRVEVLNLGVAAVASFPVRKLAEEALARVDPDLLLIYCGHNEFYGASGVASFQFMGRSTRAMETVYQLRQLALVQLAEALLGGAPPVGGAPPGREHLIQVMAAVPRIAPDGELHEAARRSLEANVAAMVQRAQARGVAALVATLVSNERDLAPIASWDGDLPRAEQVYAQAQALEAAGQVAEAAESYRLARDLDAMPWRAARDKNRLLRALAERERVPLADCEASFAAAAGGATGWGQFVDHVHPSLPGQALLARCLLDAIVAHQLLPVDHGRLADLPDWRQTAAELGAHPLELYLIADKMATLFRSPPLGEHNQRAAEYAEQLRHQLETHADGVDREALRRWREACGEAGRTLPISYFAGTAALAAGDWPRARGYLRAAVENAYPWSDQRSAARLLLLLAELRAQATVGWSGRVAEALVEARQGASLAGPPSALQAQALAGLLALAGEGDEALRQEQHAQALAPAAPPWMRTYLRQLPGVAQLQRHLTP